MSSPSPQAFKSFAHVVNQRVKHIVHDPTVFEVEVDRDRLWEIYLGAFPEGTNPIFKVRTEHDCSCCKSFVRGVGAIVRIGRSGELETVWDTAAEQAQEPYRTVAMALRDHVRQTAVSKLFRRSEKESSSGSEVTRSQEPESGRAITWNHFWSGTFPRPILVKDFSEVARHQTAMQTAERAFEELGIGFIDTVLELINANAIYRGQEHRGLIAGFRQALHEWIAIPTEGPARSVFLARLASERPAVAAFRGTVIGSLVVDLAKGVPLEDAVRMFEAKVAPQNYKRTSALVTPAMVSKAMDTIRELDLEPALNRRLARLDDINVRDVLWTNGSVRPQMKGGIEGLLLEASKPKSARATKGSPDTGAKIPIDQFVENVLPHALELDVLVENRHLGNLMVLTAPATPEAAERSRALFKWGNGFAWSYGGNVTDAIAERVKAAGGKVDDAALRVSLAWWNTDDLDLHCQGPRGEHIYYMSKTGSYTGGRLDVDMNVVNYVRDPVENIAWSRLVSGIYQIDVHNFTLRERIDLGFTLQVAIGGRNGTINTFTYEKGVGLREMVACLRIAVDTHGNVNVESIHTGLTSSERSVSRWGINTGDFVRVNAVSLSPNYWSEDGAHRGTGNKHTFFMLDGCVCDEPARGIYNEFLDSRLDPHRKVFELLGEKTKCAVTDSGGKPLDHVAGLGFSTTRPEEITVRVKANGDGRVRQYIVTTLA